MDGAGISPRPSDLQHKNGRGTRKNWIIIKNNRQLANLKFSKKKFEKFDKILVFFFFFSGRSVFCFGSWWPVEWFHIPTSATQNFENIWIPGIAFRNHFSVQTKLIIWCFHVFWKIRRNVRIFQRWSTWFERWCPSTLQIPILECCTRCPNNFLLLFFREKFIRIFTELNSEPWNVDEFSWNSILNLRTLTNFYGTQFWALERWRIFCGT